MLRARAQRYLENKVLMNLGSIFVALSDVSFLIGTWYNFCYGKSTMRCDWALEMIIGTGSPSYLSIVTKFRR